MFSELCAKTCFSFLEGGSQPREVLTRATELGLDAVAIADRDGMYGLARAFDTTRKAARAGLATSRLVSGAELTVGGTSSRLVLLVRDRAGYASLCRLLTLAHADRPKGEPELDRRLVAEHARGLVALLPSPYDASLAETMREALGEHAFLVAHRHGTADDGRRDHEVRELSARLDVPIVASARPLYHDRSRRRVVDVLACIRQGLTLDEAGTRIAPNAEAFLRGEVDMRRLFRDDDEWLDRTGEIAQGCTFSLADLGYRFPITCVRAGETPDRTLSRLCDEHLPWRYPEGVPAAVRAQLDKELSLIARLGVAPYFLSVHEIVQIARDKRILCQGRGSAANSAVCFVLGVTSVDPARSSLLFERFLSEERNEPPDIDVDFEHERREEVIQEIYSRWGRDRAAMVSEIISYRGKSAVREVGKAFGLSLEQVDRLSSLMMYGDSGIPPERVREAGLDPDDDRLQQVLAIAREIEGFPRHLSIHVGGFVLSEAPLSEVAPVEPARMENRTVIPWDKDDLDVLGFFKVDVLALGMLTAIRKALALVRPGEDPISAMAQIPAEDPLVYDAFCRADTVGVFQIESRAQMAMLPNLRPRKFYDVVVEVAIVRPGPIQGGMVHPYLRRRAGKEPVTVPHPSLEPILSRTLGVPLFQEQVMQLAIVGAGYTGGEADELRRDMAAWKKTGALMRHRQKLLDGFVARGVSEDFAEALFRQIQGFGEYGFPESHAASFALLVYASGWLKVHFPAAFACSLINSQPMGFYSASAIVQDAQRHGVRVLPVCALASDWDCTLDRDGAMRLGLRLVKGLAARTAESIVWARVQSPPSSVDDLARRARLDTRSATLLAEAGAFEGLREGRREALWEARAPRTFGLFASVPSNEPRPRLRALAPAEQLVLDYARTGLSVGDHPMRHLRKTLPHDVKPAATLLTTKHGSMVAVAGLVQSRQRPGTASGVVFVTLEDETGTCNIVIWSTLFEENRHVAVNSPALLVRGTLEREGQVVHVVARTLERVDERGLLEEGHSSRDFH
jgi:error-prone DNA polymerase